MRSSRAHLFLTVLLLLASGSGIAAEISEKDYFSDLPEVLTVTRLAQPLSETPGAVTIIDRETIRRSGARELVDVLRLVPGYLVGGWNGANPLATYHAPLDDYGTRNLVLVDGRSVYSSFLLGDTHRGMMGILLEDIERIEVLRGANSAAYGANAMFGVINIVTRHSMDSRGVELSVTGGEGGIQDNYARLGWGDETASFRLTTGRRKDSGYLQAHDDKIVSQLHFRTDLRPAADQEIFFAGGVIEQSAGDGFPGYFDNGNPERNTGWQDVYLQGAWQYQLSPTEQFKFSASYDEETIRDHYPYRISDDENNPTVVLETVNISFGGRARRWNLEFQHQLDLGNQWRAVWGAGYKHEEAISAALYQTPDAVAVDEKRLFGSLEWRPHARWLINASGFLGDHSRKGSYFMPRLMANFHVTDRHTLRAGSTKSVRMPNIYELAADRRYYPDLMKILAPATPFLWYERATGQVSGEILKTEEIGYFGNFSDLRSTLDIRAYRERMLGVVDSKKDPIPGYPVRQVDDFVNYRDFETRGIEFQFRWKPFSTTEVWLNHNEQSFHWTADRFSPATVSDYLNNMPPQRASTLAVFQKLPGNFDLSVIHSTTSGMTWRDQTRKLGSISRTDMRIAYPFRIGATRAEASLAVQALGGDYIASYTNSDFPPMSFERRAFGTLRLEF